MTQDQLYRAYRIGHKFNADAVVAAHGMCEKEGLTDDPDMRAAMIQGCFQAATNVACLVELTDEEIVRSFTLALEQSRKEPEETNEWEE